jgi:hypothetical protein
MRKKSKQVVDLSTKKRKNFRLPLDLTLWAEDYARRKNTNMTQLIVDHLTKLKERDSK